MIALEPGTIHTFEHLLEKLQTRTRRELNTLHFVSQDGYFKCLDLRISASTLNGLIEACRDRLASMPVDEILYSASPESWQEIFGKKMAWRRVMREIRNPVSGKYVAAALVEL